MQQLRFEREPLKPAQNLAVSLELADHRRVEATTNARGRAFIALPEDVLVPGRQLTVTLRAGSFVETFGLVVPAAHP